MSHTYLFWWERLTPVIRYTEQYQPRGYTWHDVPCTFCGKTRDVTLPAAGVYAYRRGDPVQVAFADVDADTREFIISATCGACFDDLFDSLDPDADRGEGGD